MTPDQLDAALEKACSGKRLELAANRLMATRACNCPLGYLVRRRFPHAIDVARLLENKIQNLHWPKLLAFTNAYDRADSDGSPFAALGLKWRAIALSQQPPTAPPCNERTDSEESS